MSDSLLIQRTSHLSLEPNPVLLEHARQRAESVQNRIADQITTFAGSMAFVYIHIVWFGCWIGFGVEKYPYGLLTMIVSLEAIFLSTFVMSSQKRGGRQAAGDRPSTVADRQGRRQPEQGSPRSLQPDPRANEGRACCHGRSIQRPPRGWWVNGDDEQVELPSPLALQVQGSRSQRRWNHSV